MLSGMEWQKPAALGVVVVTAALFLWVRLRSSRWLPRRWRTRWQARIGGCGCGAGSSASGMPGLVVQGR
ncbi:MAG: hypothetical protein EBU81_12475, partial [Proteobacteria bacterium]|nr:hypothetical protein [Pseudomonadota bacterium]